MRSILFLLAATAFGQGTVPTNGTWVPIQAHGGPAEILGYNKTTYVSSIDAHCMWGAYKQTRSTEPDQSLLCYSYSENRWIVMGVSGQWSTDVTPAAGHSNGVFTYMSDLDSIAHYTDGSGSNVAAPFNHFFAYDVAGRFDRDRALAGTTARPWMSATTPSGNSAYDPATHKLLMFPTFVAGEGPGSGGRGRLWNSTTNTFTLATTTGQPSTALANFAATTVSGVAYFYAGADIYQYTFGSDTWATISPASCTGTCTGNKPPTRLAAGFDCSSVDNICLMAGGTTSFGGTAKTDTWVYDINANTWAEQSPAASYFNNNTNTTWDRMRYDVASNVFVMLTMGTGGYADGSWSYQVARPYVFAYSTALGYGRTVNTYTPTAGGLNRVTATATVNTALGTQSWANFPALAVNGTTVAAGWTEAFTYFSATNCGADPKPYVQTTPNSSTWTNLPTGTQTTACQAIDPDASQVNFAEYLQLAYVNSVLWEAHQKWNNSGSLYSAAYAQQWTGSAWSGGAVGCYTAACGANVRQNPFAMIAVGTTPTLAVIEMDHTVTPNAGNLYVTQYGGASWAQIGSGRLNNSGGTSTRALGASLATDGTNTYVCWNEEVDSSNTQNVTTNAQIFCKKWDTSSWSSIISGATLNRTSTSWAGKPAATYVGSKLYVAWTERTDAGVAKLYVISWDGASVVLLGGAAINTDATTGWAAQPSLTNDGTNVYIAWGEQQALGQHVLGYVKKWNGSSWSTVGGAIAADTTNGSIEGITLRVVGTSPTATWTEAIYGNLRQTYIQQWNGLSWGALGQGPATRFVISQ